MLTSTPPPIVVDALLGTGFDGDPRGAAADAISVLADARPRTLSIDIPSGVNGLTGAAGPLAVHAEATVTFVVPKLGLLREPGRRHAGEIIVADIGIPDDVVAEAGTVADVMLPRDARAHLPARPSDGHKGTFGHVLVVGGSPDLGGAVALAAGGALRSGAGLVTIAVPASLRNRVAAFHPEATSIELAESADGTCAVSAVAVVESFVNRHRGTVVALGPGLSGAGESPEFARRLARGLAVPMVIDADGLNAFAGDASSLRDAAGPRVLTPHPGEAGRLLGVETADIVADPFAAARRLASLTGAVVVLKGAPSVAAEPGGEVWMNTTGNSGMARGGSGDVLTGVIAAFLAQGMEPFPAAILGSYVHGLAGDIAARRKTGWGMVAGDIARYLPSAFKLIERCRTMRASILERT